MICCGFSGSRMSGAEPWFILWRAHPHVKRLTLYQGRGLTVLPGEWYKPAASRVRTQISGIPSDDGSVFDPSRRGAWDRVGPDRGRAPPLGPRPGPEALGVSNGRELICAPALPVA